MKVLNINGFAQPQRMRIDNTEEVMQKRNHHVVSIIPSVTNKCLFLRLSLPHLLLAYVLILAAQGCCFLSSTVLTEPGHPGLPGWGARLRGREYVKKETSLPAFHVWTCCLCSSLAHSVLGARSTKFPRAA